MCGVFYFDCSWRGAVFCPRDWVMTPVICCYSSAFARALCRPPVKSQHSKPVNFRTRNHFFINFDSRIACSSWLKWGCRQIGGNHDFQRYNINGSAFEHVWVLWSWLFALVPPIDNFSNRQPQKSSFFFTSTVRTHPLSDLCKVLQWYFDFVLKPKVTILHCASIIWKTQFDDFWVFVWNLVQRMTMGRSACN